MAETITHTWQTVEQAAVTLNVSTRTIARRLANGSLESRVDDNGRRLVLVQQIGAGEESTDFSADTDIGADEGVLTASAVPAGTSQGMAMLQVLQSTVTAARDDARTARRNANWAWAGIGVMSLLLFGAAVLVSSTLTRSTVTATMLQSQLAETKTELTQTQSELSATRIAEARTARDLSDARQTLETQQRQLAIVIAEPKPAAAPVAALPAAVPATQPTFIDRVVSLFE